MPDDKCQFFSTVKCQAYMAQDDDSGAFSKSVRVNTLWSSHVCFISSSDSPGRCTGEHFKEKAEKTISEHFSFLCRLQSYRVAYIQPVRI